MWSQVNVKADTMAGIEMSLYKVLIDNFFSNITL